MIEFGDDPDMKLYRVSSFPLPTDTNLYRYHRERSQCLGLFSYTISRPMICPGCGGRWQGNVVERTRRRFREWLLRP